MIFGGLTLHRGIDDALLSQLIALMERAFPAEYGERWSAMQFESMLASPLAWLVTAENPDQPGVLAGFALGRSVVDEVEIMLLGVDPDMRRQGVAAKLMALVEEEARIRNVRSIFVEVRETNPARQFYEQSGFSIIGRRADYYASADGQRIAALTMAKTF